MSEEKLADAITAALKGLGTRPEDAGTVRLALAYAGQIDEDPKQLLKLGPGLLTVLESLGMSPKGRAAITGKGAGSGDVVPHSRAKELRERRAAREHAAPAVD